MFTIDFMNLTSLLTALGALALALAQAWSIFQNAQIKRIQARTIDAIAAVKQQSIENTKKLDIANEKTAVVAADVRKIELATNSMQTALVAATRSQALLEGAGKERVAHEAREALRAEGAASVTQPEPKA